MTIKDEKKEIDLNFFVIALTAVVIFSIILGKINEEKIHINPNYSKIDISQILNKKTLNKNDYDILFNQTGLGKCSIDSILSKKNGAKKILHFQDNFFTIPNVYGKRITPFTSEEFCIDNENHICFATDLAPLENGYILLTRATHSFNWRHGHAAIVIDAERGYILEAAVMGQKPQISSINKWRLYPNYIILKPKNINQEQLNQITDYALNELNDVPYRLTSGIFFGRYKENTIPTGTHCSHLVWYPYMAYGYDIDSDGGMIVTPKDIANSNLLEIVQVYGFDINKLWR